MKCTDTETQEFTMSEQSRHAVEWELMAPISSCKQPREQIEDSIKSLETSGQASSDDILPPARPHILTLPKQPPAGDQLFRCWRLMRTTLFKLPH